MKQGHRRRERRKGAIELRRERRRERRQHRQRRQERDVRRVRLAIEARSRDGEGTKPFERIPLPLSVQLGESEQHFGRAAEKHAEERDEKRRRWEASFLGRLQQTFVWKKLANQGVGVAAIVGFLIVAGLVALALNQASHEKIEEAMFTPPPAPEKSNIELLEEAEEALKAYCAVKEWRDLLPLVRHPEVVEPLMEQWYAKRPYQPLPMPEIRSSKILRPEGRFIASLGYLNDKTGYENYHLVELTNGVLKVDWEIAANYQEMSWEEFVKQRPIDGRQFRVHFLREKHGYYNMAFSDPQVWESYRLDVHGTSELIHAYVRRGTKLSFILRAYSMKVLWTPAILTLTVPVEDSDGAHVEITSMEQDSWFISYD